MLVEAGAAAVTVLARISQAPEVAASASDRWLGPAEGFGVLELAWRTLLGPAAAGLE